MKKQFFITGTDTDAGKTYFSTGLLAAAKRKGFRTAGLKPVAAGAIETEDGFYNEDALSLMEQTTAKLSYDQINPVLLKPAIAPHIAAQQVGKTMSVDRLTGYVKGALLVPYDFAIVEGAGGWRVPISDRALLSDLAKELAFPVIMVVNMKLGCINHALLSAEAIARDGLKLAGWVANFQDEMPCYKENVATLKTFLSAPLLGELPRTSEENSEPVFDSMLSTLLNR